MQEILAGVELAHHFLAIHDFPEQFLENEEGFLGGEEFGLEHGQVLRLPLLLFFAVGGFHLLQILTRKKGLQICELRLQVEGLFLEVGVADTDFLVLLGQCPVVRLQNQLLLVKLYVEGLQLVVLLLQLFHLLFQGLQRRGLLNLQLLR